MTVHYLIIHDLEKEVQGETKLTLSKSTLGSSDEKTVSLVEELNSCYRNNITRGIFKHIEDDDIETFQKEFDKYLAKRSKASFTSLSKKTAKTLCSRINSIVQAKGGYLVYVDYSDKQKNHFFLSFSSGIKKIKDSKMRMA